jgi:hypothetical protein
MDWMDLLKSSSIMDFAFIFAVLLASVAMFAAAIVVVIVAKTRKPVYVLLCLAILPFLLALAGAAYRLYRNEQLLAANEIRGERMEEWRVRFREEFLMMCLIGTPGTVLPVLIGTTALFLKKAKPP